ncbi:extracellular solute-binding protein [Oscillochloris trichoides DG-6]|uniref:Extracellular solute-binding protein n=1 Tax=Oscillochloris trichoides DG-6 TaxID=765420 RepID=E1IF96_9CHLR|nr:amino acid ABC transporter substrate-binding protein [Oscillochloris trichoides]EFO80136.1 extracellular solute-binding protein [Oscillochloris trichoides DG-6]
MFRPHLLAVRFAALASVLLLAACSMPFGQQATPEPVIVIVTATPDPRGQPTGVPVATPVGAATATLDPTLTVVAEATPTPASSGLLERVKARGKLICGTNADLPGFGFYDNVRGRWSGFDVDFCRALAAAIFADADAVEFVALNTSGQNERFESVRSGKVDVLFRNTTWTLGRDLSQLAFGPTTFHDGQTFMVRTASQITSLNDLAGKKICVSRGTTSAQNLSDDFAARGIVFEQVLYDDENQLYPAYDQGACDAVTSDSSQLASKRQTLERPEDHTILGERISREPLGPAFIEHDEQWRDVVTWVVFATMYAEELRVDQTNVEQMKANSTDPRVRRLLGLEGDFGTSLGLNNDFGYQIIRLVGNYADIYNRNLGPTTPFAMDRGPNKAWNLGAGGVLASPPFR